MDGRVDDFPLLLPECRVPAYGVRVVDLAFTPDVPLPPHYVYRLIRVNGSDCYVLDPETSTALE